MNSLQQVPKVRSIQLHRTNGFTILELMILTAVFATLLALLVPALAAARTRSREVGSSACVRNMKRALDNYYSDWGSIYPIMPGGTGDIRNAGDGVLSPGFCQTPCSPVGTRTVPAPEGVEDNSTLTELLTANKYLAIKEQNMVRIGSKSLFVDHFRVPIICRFLIKAAIVPGKIIVSNKLTQKAYVWSYGSDLTNWQNAAPTFINQPAPFYDGSEYYKGSEAANLEAAPLPQDNNLTSWR
jgi:type II secretory pathway pseudopilin PulG